MPRRSNNRISYKRNQSRSNKVVSELQKQTKYEAQTALSLMRSFAPPIIPDVQAIQMKKRMFYQFTRSQSPVAITTSTTAETNYAVSFSLNSLPDFGEFVTLFDEYRIIQVVVNVFPALNTTAGLTVTAFCAIDYNDALGVAIDQLQEYGTMQAFRLDQGVRRVINPRSPLASYVTSSSVASAPTYGKWISTENPDVQHFGFKLSVPQTGNEIAVNATYRYVLQFRNAI